LVEITDWYQANQACLMAEVERVRCLLQRKTQPEQAADAEDSPKTVRRKAAGKMAAASALETLCALFRLSPFERDVLVLCAGMELDSRIAGLCAEAQNDPLRTYPTWGLALAVLPDSHWSALTPDASLRRWKMIETGTGHALTLSPLRLDERILHYLAGAPNRDERLAGLIELREMGHKPLASHACLAERIADCWEQTAGNTRLPAIQLCGDDPAGAGDIAAAACARLRLKLMRLAADALPTAPAELDVLARLWEREAALDSSALLVDGGENDTPDSAQTGALVRFVERIAGPVFLVGRERRELAQRPLLTFAVPALTASEQRQIWRNVLEPESANAGEQAENLAAQFHLTSGAIHRACVQAQGVSDEERGRALWDACRIQARSRMDDLAQRIEPAADWDDLVLPTLQKQTLEEIVAHVRQRGKVYEQWGFANKGARGLGISALFAGASGTGKTLAAEVLANTLNLDLYRIDLSQVVSKYIGETEKNLRRVFDAAESGGAVLLFDEADALFGKRSEVKDSHDRYANIEVSYLLQRMEAYRGLAILTTNLKSALDTAFLRRLRFVVDFPFPDMTQRAEIWRRIFPADTPTEGLDPVKLARLNVAGGNIRNIALNAAFLAADAGEPVRMAHMRRAAGSEYAKLEKPLSESECAGW
jgi:hypothetical protein